MPSEPEELIWLNPEPARVAYTNHFATCEFAKSFRKKQASTTQ